jgi:hypothetical protein
MHGAARTSGAKRRSSAKQYGGKVNFSKAAGKATTKRYGAPPKFGKEFQLV